MGIQLPGVEADELESWLTCLAAHGAEVRALDPRNRIALSWARNKHREEVVKLLREAGGAYPLTGPAGLADRLDLVPSKVFP